MAALAPAYRPRRPTETVLYGIVRRHLETFLAHARESYEAPLPRYVEEELRAYLRCGVFARGFVRCHCDACGHDLLVAFSCKGRTVCPSCAGRRMANVAAQLVDRVLPVVPIRQWVLSLPFELRALAAFRPDVLSALGRIFVEAIFAHHRGWAKRRGLTDAPSGAVTHVQRFGSSINLNVHFHVMVLDGVYSRDAEGRAVFHLAPPPSTAELDAVVRRVHRRAAAWLARKKLVRPSPDEDGGSGEAPAQTSLDACAAIAMRRGSLQTLRDTQQATDDGEASAPGAHAHHDGAVDYDGFNLHAAVRMTAEDDVARERLMRYGARPPLSVARLRVLPGGRIAYRLKKLRDGRAKVRVMTPLEFLARLAALVAPPRYPLLRYHGVLGPRSAWRRDVVPKPPEFAACPATKPSPAPAARHADPDRPRPPSRDERPPRAGSDAPRANASLDETSARPASPPSPLAYMGGPSPTPADVLPPGLLLAPNILRVKHWQRLAHGALYAASPRVDWATLLRRTFDVDVLRCAECGGRLRVLGELTEPGQVRLVLESLGLPPEEPRAARARDPTELLGDAEADA